MLAINASFARSGIILCLLCMGGPKADAFFFCQTNQRPLLELTAENAAQFYEATAAIFSAVALIERREFATARERLTAAATQFERIEATLGRLSEDASAKALQLDFSKLGRTDLDSISLQIGAFRIMGGGEQPEFRNFGITPGSNAMEFSSALLLCRHGTRHLLTLVRALATKGNFEDRTGIDDLLFSLSRQTQLGVSVSKAATQR